MMPVQKIILLDLRTKKNWDLKIRIKKIRIENCIKEN